VQLDKEGLGAPHLPQGLLSTGKAGGVGSSNLSPLSQQISVIWVNK
jgi:hypothetical protein